MKKHLYTLIFTIFALLSFGSVSCMSAADLQNGKQTTKMDKLDSVCIVIPNLPIQDTLYVRHEDTTATAPKTWWGENKELIVTILGAVLSLIIGLVVAFYSAHVNQKSNTEQYIFQHQTQLETEAKNKAKKIYTCICTLKRANTPDTMQPAIDELGKEIDEAELDVPDAILERALAIHTYYVSVMEDANNQDDIKKNNLINAYIAQVKNQ